MVNPSARTVREVLNQQIIDYTEPLVKNLLTSGGIQYSDAVDTTTASTNITIFSKTINPPKPGTVLFNEFGLTAEFRTVASTTTGMYYQWQTKNNVDSTWTNLHASATNMLVSTVFVASTVQGYNTSGCTQVPFDIRLLLNCNQPNEGRARIHNASYVRTVYY